MTQEQGHHDDVPTPQPVCTNCMTPNTVDNHFCSKCGMPLTPLSVFDPLKCIAAQGWGFRRACSGRVSPLLFWGMWAMFGPAVFMYVIAVWQGLAYMQQSWMELALASGLILLYALILLRATKAYLRSRHIVESWCPKCQTDWADSRLPTCPRCGTELQPSQDALGKEPVSLNEPALERLLSHISEEEFPIRCRRCDYLLTGLGSRGICPECGSAFDRYDALQDTYGTRAFDPRALLDVEREDWASVDTGHISRIDYPIRCAECGATIEMPRQEGTCPVCSKRYFHAERLFETYGPELFAHDVPLSPHRPGPEETQLPEPRIAVRVLCFVGIFFALGISYSFAQHKPAGETITILVMMFLAAWVTEFMTR